MRRRIMFKFKKIVLLIVMVCCLALTSLTGCSGEPPTDTVVLFMDSLIDYDLETAVSLLEGEEDLDDLTVKSEEEVLVKAVFGQITYEEPVIVSEEGDEAVVSVKITAPDMPEIVSKV